MDLIQSTLDSLKDSWLTYTLAVVGFVVGLAKFLDALKRISGHWSDFKAKLSGQKISDQKLKDSSKEIAQKIMKLVGERQASEPSVDFENFQYSTHQMSKHSQETQNIYATEYAGKVNALRDEFLTRELQDDELDRFYQHPTNYIGLKLLAIGLATLSEKIE